MRLFWARKKIDLTFTKEGLEEVAAFAEETNARTENIGARRLYTIMEKILSDISFEAPEKPGEKISIDKRLRQSAPGRIT